MFDIFRSVKGLLKLDQVCIDNNICLLHYKVTVVLLITFSLFVTSNQYIGDPIDCIIDDVPPRLMDTYCWIYSTYTIPNRMLGSIGHDLIAPGVTGYVDGEDQVKYHKYYQWVCFALFFQAILFYVPRFLWKRWEGERVKRLVGNLNMTVINLEEREERKKIVINYFKENFNRHNFYVSRFFFCETLYYVNIIGQMWFMDYFLDGEFSTYGINVLRFTSLDPEIRNDPMARVFPKVTKCAFLKYGPSGNIQKLDGLCVLPLNIINEKIYVFLWFWFLFLSTLTALEILYRYLVFCIPKLRFYLLLRTQKSRKSIETILEKCKIGDWFILHQLSKNIDSIIFEEIVEGIAQQINCNP